MIRIHRIALRAGYRFGIPVFALMLVVLAMLPGQAFAANEGSRAWASQFLLLSSGPGAGYEDRGTIAAGEAILVERCQRQFCLVNGNGQRGWTALGRIRFGLEARGGLTGPRFVSIRGAQACLYEGANYSGATLCIPNGKVYNDLQLVGLDNRFSSIKIEGEGTVTLCRDRFFQSYCTRISASQPVLPQYLNNALSSVHVW